MCTCTYTLLCMYKSKHMYSLYKSKTVTTKSKHCYIHQKVNIVTSKVNIDTSKSKDCCIKK